MPFKCVCESGDGSMCGEQLSTLSKLSEHISLMHLSYTPYMCKLCFCQTPSQPQLELHAKMMHPDQPTTRWLSFCGDEVKQQQLEQLLAAAGTGKQPQPGATTGHAIWAVMGPNLKEYRTPKKLSFCGDEVKQQQLDKLLAAAAPDQKPELGATDHASSPGPSASADGVAPKPTTAAKAKRGVQKELEALLINTAHLSKYDTLPNEAKRHRSTGFQSLGSSAAAKGASASQKTQSKQKNVSKQEPSTSETIKKETDSAENREPGRKLSKKLSQLKTEAHQNHGKQCSYPSHIRCRAKQLWHEYRRLHSIDTRLPSKKFANKIGIPVGTLGHWMKSSEHGDDDLLRRIKSLVSAVKVGPANRQLYPYDLPDLALQYVAQQKVLDAKVSRVELCHRMGLPPHKLKRWQWNQRQQSLIDDQQPSASAPADSPALPQQTDQAHQTTDDNNASSQSSAANKIKAKYLKTKKLLFYSVRCYVCNKRVETSLKQNSSEAEQLRARWHHLTTVHGSKPDDLAVYFQCFPRHMSNKKKQRPANVVYDGDTKTVTLVLPPKARAPPDRCECCSGRQFQLKRRRYQPIPRDGDHLMYQCANRCCGKAASNTGYRFFLTVGLVRKHMRKLGIPVTDMGSQFIPWITHAQYKAKTGGETGVGSTPTSSCGHVSDNEAEAMEDVQPRVVLPVDEVMLAADTPDNEEEPAHTPSQADSGSPRSSSTPSLLERIDLATRPPVAAVKSEHDANIFEKSYFD